MALDATRRRERTSTSSSVRVAAEIHSLASASAGDTDRTATWRDPMKRGCRRVVVSRYAMPEASCADALRRAACWMTDIPTPP